MQFFRGRCGRPIAYALFIVLIGFAITTLLPISPPIGPAHAQVGGVGPPNTLGDTSDSEMWRAIRRGERGNVSIPDKQSGVMIQSEGDNWRSVRNGPLTLYGGWSMLATLVLLGLFFALRGRIKIDAGASGRTIERFNAFERFAHWLVAGSFIVLGLTGLNLLYGRYVLMPILGAEFFSAVTLAGKYAHNYVAFAFMLGLVLILVLWIRDNMPNRTDLTWLAKGGGMFGKNNHPPAKRFNAGQKIVFWLVLLGGASISLSGLALMFPFQFALFGGTFELLNLIGFDLPTQLTALQEMQLSQIWHAVMGLALIVLILAHIYIATIGMEGAFGAMGSGQVDVNWAKEHHSLWATTARRDAAGADD